MKIFNINDKVRCITCLRPDYKEGTIVPMNYQRTPRNPEAFDYRVDWGNGDVCCVFYDEIERVDKMAKLICSDGKEINISAETEKELRKAFEPKKVTYKVGDKFESYWCGKKTGDTFTLTHCSYRPQKAGLINDRDSMLWHYAIEVNDYMRITEDELNKMYSSDYTFKKID